MVVFEIYYEHNSLGLRKYALLVLDDLTELLQAHLT